MCRARWSGGIASALMRRHEIPVIDLYSHVLPVLDRYQQPDNCHYKEDGYAFLGRFVADSIRNHLEI